MGLQHWGGGFGTIAQMVSAEVLQNLNSHCSWTVQRKPGPRSTGNIWPGPQVAWGLVGTELGLRLVGRGSSKRSMR